MFTPGARLARLARLGPGSDVAAGPSGPGIHAQRSQVDGSCSHRNHFKLQVWEDNEDQNWSADWGWSVRMSPEEQAAWDEQRELWEEQQHALSEEQRELWVASTLG